MKQQIAILKEKLKRVETEQLNYSNLYYPDNSYFMHRIDLQETLINKEYEIQTYQ